MIKNVCRHVLLKLNIIIFFEENLHQYLVGYPVTDKITGFTLLYMCAHRDLFIKVQTIGQWGVQIFFVNQK